MIPANVRATQLDDFTINQLRGMLNRQYAIYPGPRLGKAKLIDLVLRKEGYSFRQIREKGPVALTRLFPL